MNRRCFALLAGVVLVLTTAALAQLPTATLVGQVTDQTNAAVVGAKIQVRDMSTNKLRTAATGSQGEYTVSALLPGVYEVTISQTGFKELVESNLGLAADQTARLDAKLEVGTERVVLTVDDTVGAINSETSSKGGVIAPVEIAEMPLNGRDFNDLAFTVAGVMPQEEGGKGTAYTNSGVRSDQSNVLIEGLNNTNPRDAGAQAAPPLDALQEFKMQTSNYSAEYGRVAGAVVNMVMKRGGNQYHGDLFEFVRNDKFDAANYFDSSTQKSKLRRNQFGGTFGGPVVIPHLYNGRDRTFFFASWESFRQVAGSNSIGTVPSLPERGIDPATGASLGYLDFSQSFNVTNGQVLAPGALKNPITGVPYPNNRVPLSDVNPLSLSLLNFYPLPNLTGLGGNNYRSYAETPDQWDNFSLKIDQQLSAKDEFSARALGKQQKSSDPFSGSDTALWPSTTRRKQLMFGITETRIFTSALINEFRLGLTRMKSDETSLDAGTNWARMLGMCKTGDPTQCPTDNPAFAQFPLFKPTGYMTLGDSTQNPIRYTTNNYNLNDIVTWNKGKHTIKFGGDVLRVQYFQATNSNFSGTLSFSGKSSNNAIADFMTGWPSSISITEGSPYNHIYDNNYAAFVQDDFKVLPSLTLNLGLRYELQTLPYEENGQWSTYVPSLHKIIMAADMTPAMEGRLKQYASDPTLFGSASEYGLPRTLVNPNYKRIAPRVGFAWRPFDNDRSVVRGGYGVFYVGSRLSALRTELSGKFPFSLPLSFTNKGVLSIDDPFNTVGTVKGQTSATGIDLDPKSSYVQSWNLTFEHEIGRGVTLEIGYTGSKGTHLGRQIDINQAIGVAADGTSIKPIDQNFGSIKYFSFNSNSNYNAGVVTVSKKFDHGLFFKANYTYGKSIDVASGFNYAGNGGFSMAQNSQDPNAERGRSDFDRRHVFSANFVYKLPIDKTVVLRGWQLAGSSVIYSGAPFTPQLNGPTLDDGVATRPNRICNGALSNPSPAQWFDLSCFPQVSNPDQVGLFGDSGRNILDGPGNFAINLALSRTFRIREKGKLQFRWEVFNVLNHPNFSLPNDNVDEPGAGTITNAKDPRVMQLGIKYSF